MADLTTERTWLTGFILPGNEWSFDADESTVDWTDPHPGAVTKGRVTAGVLQAFGEPINNDTIEVNCRRGGRSPEIIYSTDAGATYLGHQPCNSLAGVEDMPVPSSGTVLRVDLCAHPSGYVSACWDVRVSGQQVAVYTSYRSPTTGNWSTPSQLSTSTGSASATTAATCATLDLQADGTIALYAFVYSGNGNFAELRKWESRDGGQTWEVAVRNVFQLAVAMTTYRTDRLSVCNSGGQWMLLQSAYHTISTEYAIFQYSSEDGASFGATGQIRDQDGAASADCIYAGGYFHVLWASEESATNNVWVFHARVGTAANDIDGATSYGVADVMWLGESTGTVYGPCKLAVEDSGRIWAYWTSNQVDTYRVYSSYSDDAGATWSAGRNLLRCYTEPVLTLSLMYAPTWIAATFQRGRMLLHAAVGAATVYSLGGWNQLALTGSRESTIFGDEACPRARWSWEDTTDELGFDEGAGDWDFTEVGSPTSAGGTISGSAVESITVELASPPSAGDARYNGWVRWWEDPSSATGKTTIDLELRVSAASLVSYRVQVEVNYGTGTITVYDVASSTSLGTASVPGSEFFLRIMQSTDKVSVYVANPNPEEQTWPTEIVKDGTLTDNGGSESNCIIKAQTHLSTWNMNWKGWWVCLGDEQDDEGNQAVVHTGEGQGEGIYSGYRNLGTRRVNNRPIYLTDGVWMRMRGGPKKNDTWTVAPDAYHHPRRCLPRAGAYLQSYPSPRQAWLAESRDSDNRLVYTRDEPWVVGSPLFGVQFIGLNVISLTVYVYDGSSWTSLGTHTPQQTLPGGGSIPTNKRSIVPVTSGTSGSGIYFRRDELAGCWVYDSSEGDAYRIAGNSEGWWDDGAVAEKRATIYLDEASTNSGTRSNLSIVYPDSVFLKHLDASTVVTKVRFDLDFGVPLTRADGETAWEAGTIAWGAVTVMGQGPDQTRAEVVEVGDELLEYPSDVEAVNDQGVTRRRLELSWANRQFPLLNNGTASGWTSSYLTANSDSGVPAADHTDAPLILRQIAAVHQREPLVWLPRIPISSTAEEAVSLVGQADRSVLARFVPGTLRIEDVQGHAETGDQVTRVAGITIREIV